LYALLFTTRYARPVTVLASDFIGELDIPFPLVAAGGIIAVVVPVALAFVFQRYIVRGIGGAVTG
ncbi:MAG TPA: carbohydrate ABC transporter permease, partial [Armatimonadota bacterium]|nr:carbohydrate ABC transporter permease [Armatimonadota bacterium]